MRSAPSPATPVAGTHRPGRSWWPELVVLTVTTTSVIVLYRWVDDPARTPAKLALAGLVVALARRAGLSWEELGLSPANAVRGLRWGLGTAGLVAAAVLALSQLPLTRDLLYDEKALGHGAMGVLVAALVTIPLGTALAEEVVFRGVGLGLVSRRTTTARAVVVTAALFAAWHGAVVLAAWPALPAASRLPGLPGLAAVGLGSVLSTFVAGLGFGWLRVRSESLVAPVLAHWSTNALMLVATYTVTR